MSWNAWTECMKRDKNGVKKSADHCGIYEIKTCAPWSESDDFKISQKEVQDIQKVLSGAGPDSFFIGQTKYIVLRKHEDFLMAKAGQQGLTAAKAATCILIGQYDDHTTVSPGVNCDRICQIKEQLASSGF